MSIVFLTRCLTPDHRYFFAESDEAINQTLDDALEAVKYWHSGPCKPVQVIALDTHNPQDSHDASAEVAEMWLQSMPDFDPREDSLPWFIENHIGVSTEQLRQEWDEELSHKREISSPGLTGRM